MARSRKSKSNAAARALDAAIAAETAELQDELRRKDAENARLRGLLSRIIGLASTGTQAVETQQVSPPQPPRLEEPPIPEGPSVDLAGEDNLGAGRWV